MKFVTNLSGSTAEPHQAPSNFPLTDPESAQSLIADDFSSLNETYKKNLPSHNPFPKLHMKSCQQSTLLPLSQKLSTLAPTLV